MFKEKFSKSLALCFGVLVMIFSLSYMVLAWTEPTLSPPRGNVSAPINVGSIGQSKAGGLIVNTGGSLIGLIVDQGSVGIGTNAPAYKLDVNGDVKGTRLCIGADCRNSWPGGSAGANYWTLSRGNIYNNVGSNVGIGTVAPTGKLDIRTGQNIDTKTLVFTEDESDFLNFYIRTFYSPVVTDSHELIFGRESTEPSVTPRNLDILTLKGNGDVGIGTNAPAYKLDVNGDVKGTRLCIGSDCRNTWPGGSSGANYWTLSRGNIYNNVGSNVGIGTSAPTQKLDVNGQARAVDFCTVAGKCLSTVGAGGTNYWTLSGNSLYPNNTGNNVGIGKTNPGYKLDVAGQVNVNTNRILGVATPIAGTDAVNKKYVDDLISAASGGGSCYYNYGGITCYSGWTPVLVGWTTVYSLTSYVTSPLGVTLECSSVTHEEAIGTYWAVAYNSKQRFTELRQERCAICCK